MLLQLWELIYIVLPRAFLYDTLTLCARSLIRVKWQRNRGIRYNSKLFLHSLLRKGLLVS